jgi:hypothetical protein
MGDIVFWAIIRTALTLAALWLLKGYVDFQLWWLICVFAIYGVIIHPIIIHYRLFNEKNKEVIENTLCSTCRHFDKSAVLCMKYDKHPTKENLPCNGMDWEPKSLNLKNKDIYEDGSSE